MKSQNQIFHACNPNVDQFMILTSRYMLASLSVMKVHTGIENSFFWYVYNSARPFKIVDNITQSISVATNGIGYDWKPSAILILLLMNKLLVGNSSGLLFNKSIYFEVNIITVGQRKKVTAVTFFPARPWSDQRAQIRTKYAKFPWTKSRDFWCIESMWLDLICVQILRS